MRSGGGRLVLGILMEGIYSLVTAGLFRILLYMVHCRNTAGYLAALDSGICATSSSWERVALLCLGVIHHSMFGIPRVSTGNGRRISLTSTVSRGSSFLHTPRCLGY